MPDPSRKLRLLYLQTSPVPPVDPSVDRFILLSERLEGVVLQPLWFRRPEEVDQALGEGAWPTLQRGAFQYRWSLTWRYHGLRRFLSGLWFYLSEGLRMHKESPFDCVMAYSHMTTALCGMVLCWLTGARLVVEVVSSPERVFLFDRPKPTLVDRLRKLYSDVCLHITLLACSRVHLLYTAQLDSYPLLRNVGRCVFHEFVACAAVPFRTPDADPVILLVGAPWYLKGADLLVAAFIRLSASYPRAKLKILGHFPDRDRLMALIGDTPRIEILPARPNKETLSIMASAAVFVLPSRCEGMGRVVLEAMASGIPVVGSNVGGIPSLIRDGENGMLFPENDSHALEACLRTLLDDPALRDRLGDRGRELANTTFSEQRYVEHFTEMIQQAAE